MNIFVFDPDPAEAALYLDDVRRNKMILETAQLLSSAMHVNHLGNNYPIYKPTHLGHPCAKWTAKSKGNFAWLLEYMKCLSNRPHKSKELI